MTGKIQTKYFIAALVICIASLAILFFVGGNPASPKYIIKGDCGFDCVPSDTTVRFDKDTIKLSWKVCCDGKTVRTDSVRTDSTVTITTFKEQVVEINFVAGSLEKNLVLSKEDFKSFVDTAFYAKAVLGSTKISSVNTDKKNIVVETFMGYPDSDNGLLLLYAFDEKGNFIFQETKSPAPSGD